jgi:hypothetical protein
VGSGAPPHLQLPLFYSSMIIRNFDLIGIAVHKAKADTPLIVNRDISASHSIARDAITMA